MFEIKEIFLCNLIISTGLSLKFQVVVHNYEISRRGIVQQGSSFGSIFLLFPKKKPGLMLIVAAGKSPAPSSLSDSPFSNTCTLYFHIVSFQDLVHTGLYVNERTTVQWNLIIRRCQGTGRICSIIYLC